MYVVAISFVFLSSLFDVSVCLLCLFVIFCLGWGSKILPNCVWIMLEKNLKETTGFGESELANLFKSILSFREQVRKNRWFTKIHRRAIGYIRNREGGTETVPKVG